MRDYMKETDRLGKIWIWTACVIVLMVPAAACVYYNAWPEGRHVLEGLLGVAPIFWTVGIIEVFTYAPMLGTGGTYLGFITGNIMNLKLPCAVNALKLTGKQSNTPEGDVVASIAVAASSIMTVAILTVAALLISFISPVFELPAVQTMSSYLLPALFGSMTLGLFASTSAGSKVVKGGMKGVIPVIILVSVITLAARLIGQGSIMLGMVGFVILVMLPISIITSRILWKKGKIVVVDKEEA